LSRATLLAAMDAVAVAVCVAVADPLPVPVALDVLVAL